MVRDYADPSSQARAYFWLAKAWFEENDPPRACGAVAIARRDAPRNAVELRTQLDDLALQCREVPFVAPIAVASNTGARAPETTAPVAPAAEATPPAVTAPTAVAASAGGDTTTTTPPRVPSGVAAVTAEPPATSATATVEPPPAARPAGARYSVQLAAYERLDQAEAFVTRLASRRVEARVDGTVKPFRVRTGYFTTRSAAAARLAELKQQGHDGFIAELTP
jgi:DedD protein